MPGKNARKREELRAKDVEREVNRSERRWNKNAAASQTGNADQTEEEDELLNLYEDRGLAAPNERRNDGKIFIPEQ